VVIYRDLTANSEAISRHPIIRGLAGDRLEDDLFGPNVPEPEQADQWHKPKSSFLVLDADSSQLACIEAVKRGTNLVIHGPPGTGKSQTIANVIAEFIVAGKTVLFVSEKMAALEVVYRRLKEANLDYFCLELHSHRANKRAVVEQIHQCLEVSPKSKRALPQHDLETLERRQRQLCDYVRALHVVRQPMARSVFDVLAELVALRRVPLVPFRCSEVSQISSLLMVKIAEAANRLQSVWHVALEGSAFPWYGCIEQAYGVATQSYYRELLTGCVASVEQVRDTGRGVADMLGIEGCPSSLEDCRWLVDTLNLLANSPRPHQLWLVTPDLDSLVVEAQQLHELTQKCNYLRKQLLGRYHPGFLDLPRSLRDQIATAYSNVTKLLHGDSTDERELLSKAEEIADWAKHFAEQTEKWESEGRRLADLLGLSCPPLTPKRLLEMIRLVDLCKSDCKPDFGWLETGRCKQLVNELPRLRKAFRDYQDRRNELLRRYKAEFFDLELGRLAEAFSREYTSWLCWLRPSFYLDRKAIANCTFDGSVPPSVHNDLIFARDTKQMRAELETQAERARALLGCYYQGIDTDFERIEQAANIAKEAIELAGCSPLPEQLRQQLAFDGEPSTEACNIAANLRSSVLEIETRARQIGNLLAIRSLPTSSLPLAETPFPHLREWATVLCSAANSLAEGIVQASEASGVDLSQSSIEELIADLDVVAQLRDIYGELSNRISSDSERLKGAYGEHFRGVETCWEDVLGGLDWAARVRHHFRHCDIPTAFIRAAVDGVFQSSTVSNLATLLQKAEAHLAELRSKFEEPHQVFLSSGQCLEGLLNHLNEMALRLDDLRDWVDFQACRQEFAELGLADLFAQLEKHLPAAEPIPKVVQRAVLQQWIEHIFEQELSLGRFRGDRHEKLLEEFRTLDRRHWQEGKHRVIAEASKRRPQVQYVPNGSEVRLLMTEALKKRRHLPIRKLFEEARGLITRLKPCILMSPLSVSQFLPPDMKFDLVIFDEASQLCTEDAIGAIYRGVQILICGDNKQLPPTAFFQSAMAEELNEDQPASEGEFAPLDSILDECLALGMPQGWLRWHYRSRHESLIAFSNYRFYNSRLVTFPSCFQADHEDLGIKFVYVADGVYDRGRRRDNKREAEVVADLVFNHFLRDQKQKSLGVIAFSQAQMETIEDEIERRLREQPKMESFFTDDRIEGFFVKNLENVQGDERDVIIFSVGNGRDSTGRMTMNFGPLNQSGGERRLNVAVTRARDKVILVSSIRASDINPAATHAPGVLVLRQYLDYAERGIKALEVEKASRGDFESPFEKDVADAIRELGYDVVPQVGCSGFRIDLGVVDPAQPERFILGIECDGASYHSSYVARDKDSIRQEVLEQQGWRIHRIWSPDWVGRRDKEIARLRAAIENARTEQTHEQAQGQDSRGATNIRSNLSSPRMIKNVGPLTNDNPKIQPSWAIPYEVWQPEAMSAPLINSHPAWKPRELMLVVQRVIEVEGPIHIEILARRLSRACGMQRTGEQFKAILTSVVAHLNKEGTIRQEGNFLWPNKRYFTLMSVSLMKKIGRAFGRLNILLPKKLAWHCKDSCEMAWGFHATH